MDPIKHQRIQSFSKPKRSHPLKITLQFILSIYVFCLLFRSYHSGILTNFNSFKFSLSTYISHLFDHYANRKIMFFISNAILLFVTRGFGLICFSRPAVDDLQGEYLAWSRAHHQMVVVVASEKEEYFEDKEVITESVKMSENAMVTVGIEEEEAKGAIEEYGGDHRCHDHRRRHYQHHHHHNLHQRQRRHWQKQQQHQKEQEQRYEQRHHHQHQQQKRQQQRHHHHQQLQQDGALIVLASDERIENFIKTRKEAMRMEAKQCLLTF